MAALPWCKAHLMEQYHCSWTAIAEYHSQIVSFVFHSDSHADEAYRIIQRVAAPDGYKILSLIRGDVVDKFFGVDLQKNQIMLKKKTDLNIPKL